MTADDLKDLLTQATDDLPQVDLAESAWVRAHSEQRRRRAWTISLGAVAAAAAVVIGVAWVGRPSGPVQVPLRPATTGASHTSPSAPPEVVTLPTMAEIRGLPPLLDVPIDLSLPAERGTLAELVAAAGEDAASLQVLALSWEELEDQLFMPVVLVTGENTEATWADVGVSVTPPDPHNNYMFAGARAISPDGRWVGLVQEHEVLFVNVRTADVQSVPLRAEDAGAALQHGGFASDGTYLTWRLWGDDPGAFAAEPQDEELVRVPEDSRPDDYALDTRSDVDEEFPVDIVRFTPVHQPAWVATVDFEFLVMTDSASGSGWVAAGGLAASELEGDAILASTTDGRTSKLVTEAGDDPDAPVGALLTPIAMLEDTMDPILLFRYEVAQGMGEPYGWEERPALFAAWNLVTDEISFVADGPALDLNTRVLGPLVNRR